MGPQCPPQCLQADWKMPCVGAGVVVAAAVAAVVVAAVVAAAVVAVAVVADGARCRTGCRVRTLATRAGLGSG